MPTSLIAASDSTIYTFTNSQYRLTLTHVSHIWDNIHTILSPYCVCYVYNVWGTGVNMRKTCILLWHKTLHADSRLHVAHLACMIGPDWVPISVILWKKMKLLRQTRNTYVIVNVYFCCTTYRWFSVFHGPFFVACVTCTMFGGTMFGAQVWIWGKPAFYYGIRHCTPTHGSM